MARMLLLHYASPSAKRSVDGLRGRARRVGGVAGGEAMGVTRFVRAGAAAVATEAKRRCARIIMTA
jgi:hypothetical protein